MHAAILSAFLFCWVESDKSSVNVADVLVKGIDEEEEGLSWDYPERRQSWQVPNALFWVCELSSVQRIWLCPVLFVWRGKVGVFHV